MSQSVVGVLSGIKHKVNILQSSGDASDSEYSGNIKNAVISTLRCEDVDKLCVVNVLISDDEGIREYNRDYRGIDKATDVLSFPMQMFLQAGWGGCNELEYDEDTGDLPLGDIVISFESAKRQAEEYGNSQEYEIAYLIIHSTLHLMGYDHDNETNEKAMHDKNKKIIKELDTGPKL